MNVEPVTTGSADPGTAQTHSNMQLKKHITHTAKNPFNLVYVLFALSAFNSLLHANAAPASVDSIEHWTLSQLEERLSEIDSELPQLSQLSLRGGVGSIGYRSAWWQTAEDKTWIQVQLDHTALIDCVVLAPTIWRTSKNGFQADAFPAAFRIVAGTENAPQGQVVAEFDEHNAHLPRIAPLVIPIEPMRATWVRLEATQLSKRYYDNYPCLQLAEFFVFSGTENVALHQTVHASSNITVSGGAWDQRYLVDGHSPYLMHSGRGMHSQPFKTEIGERPPLTIDLEDSYPISRIRLHALEQDDTVPQVSAGGLGIPEHLKIWGATDAAFTDPILLFNYQKNNIYGSGPFIEFTFVEQNVRFVQLLAQEGNDSMPLNPTEFRIGFAEVELFSRGKNVAMGKPAQMKYTQLEWMQSLSALTDGSNLYGKLLPIRDWLEELALRHELEKERPLIVAELNQRYARQKQRLRIMTWTAIAFAISIGFLILIERNLRLKNAVRIKQRIAANLHDELGANLHAIGMLGRLVTRSKQSEVEASEAVERICEIAERTSKVTRHCTNLLESNIIGENIAEEIKRDSSRLLAGLEHDLDFQGEEHFERVKNRRRIDLILFNKECLANIVRHSQATSISTRLVCTKKQLTLTIQDNGKGTIDRVPPSLQRRAKLMRATVQINQPATSGTMITLTLKLRKFGSFL
jgi:signal transduction histidine kinase